MDKFRFTRTSMSLSFLGTCLLHNWCSGFTCACIPLDDQGLSRMCEWAFSAVRNLIGRTLIPPQTWCFSVRWVHTWCSSQFSSTWKWNVKQSITLQMIGFPEKLILAIEILPNPTFELDLGVAGAGALTIGSPNGSHWGNVWMGIVLHEVTVHSIFLLLHKMAHFAGSGQEIKGATLR